MFIPQVKDIDYAYSYFFENNGDGTFTDVSEDVGVQVWNTDGACWVDYNNDGYIDLTVEGQYPFGGKREIRLFRNNGGNDNKWLEIGVKASESNSASIGARVMVSYNGITQMKEIEGGTAGHSYQNSLVQHFGFGDHDSGVDVEVWWPSGRTKLLSNISLDQKIVISEYDHDLKLSKMSFSSQEPPQGEIVTITAMIQNVGNLDVDSAKVKFFDGDINTDLIGIYNLKTINPGKEEYAQITWNTKGRSGDHTISVLIDEVLPGEDYLHNNMGKKDISVKEPDLTVSKISFSESTPQEGEIVLITATIHNIGDYNVQSAKIKFFDGDINFYPIDTIELFDIASGENAYTYTEWDTTGKIGSYTITVIIEDVVPEEENTQNNVASKNIEVKKYEQPHPPPEEPTNHPPTIMEIIVEPANVLIEESCTITVIAEDMDGDDLNYLYQPEDGAIIGFGSVVLWYAPERLGVFEITVTVEDTSNAEDVGRVYVEVIPNSPPEILNAKVSSVTVFNNGIDRVLFTVNVVDKNGLEDIDEVRIDLSEIGGSSRQRMYDDGTKGDKIAGDGIFSCEAVIVEGIEPGEKMLRITVEDKSGEESTYDVLLLVLSEEKEESEDFSGLIPIFLFFAVIVILIVAVIAVSIFSGRREKKGKAQHR
jgi:hypothetical protein